MLSKREVNSEVRSLEIYSRERVLQEYCHDLAK